MKMSATKVTRMAGLGAFAVSAVLMLAFVLFCWFIAPRGVGIDGTQSAVAQIAVGSIFIALIAVHVVFGRVLLNSARASRST